MGAESREFSQLIAHYEAEAGLGCSAHPCSAFADRVEDGLHVGGGPADDAEHFGRGGLVLQRLPQGAIALLELVEQPHVFDGDDGLIREGLDELDLALGKGCDLQAPKI